MVYGLWFMVYGLWFMVYGLWFMVYGLWFMVYGLWFMVYGPPIENDMLGTLAAFRALPPTSEHGIWVSPLA
jgi:hypothetical protein